MTPLANSETKEARTMKLCTDITYYKTSITKQLKIPIVCGYCSVLCLMGKSKLKNDQIFKFFQIKSNSHSPFNEDPKNTFFSREALISGKGRPENLRKMDNNSDIYCFANPWVVNLERAYQPGTNIPVMPQFSYVPDQILGNIEKGPKFVLSLGSFLPKI